jgi:hypothetical protein
LLVGTPVWNASVSAPVRSLLAGPLHGLGKLAFFLTEGGQGDRRVFREMAEVAGCEPRATLALRQRDVEQDRTAAAIGPFVNAVRGCSPAPAPSA